MLHPQNGDRVVAVDSVTSFHPVYREGRLHGMIADFTRY